MSEGAGATQGAHGLGYRDKRILVTGATGLIGKPISLALAEHNDVIAVARFSKDADRTALHRAGVTTVPFDLNSTDLSTLPASVDVVIHLGGTVMAAGAATDAQPGLLEVNVQATGRLMSRYRDAEAFVYASSGAVYAFRADRPHREDDPYGLMNGLEDYSLSKIVAEQLVQFLSVEWSLPTTILRIVGAYGPRGGLLTMRVDTVRAGGVIGLYPGVPNRTTALYESDLVTSAVHAARAASVPPLTLNFTGSEVVTVRECCEWAAEYLGVEAKLVDSDATVYPMLLDTAKLERVAGRSRVSVRDGIQRVVDADPAVRLDSWSAWRTTAPSPDQTSEAGS